MLAKPNTQLRKTGAKINSVSLFPHLFQQLHENHHHIGLDQQLNWFAFFLLV
jgi:hypothetical protein